MLSRTMMDALTKHFPEQAHAAGGDAHAAARGGVMDTLLLGQIESKHHKHNLYLDFLQVVYLILLVY